MFRAAAPRSVASMPKERLKSPRARLFVALDLPEGLRDGIVAWGKRELRDAALRVVPGPSLHITLAFLGYAPEKEVGRLAEVLDAIEGGRLTIELKDPVAKPSPGRAQVFALPARSPSAVALQAELEKGLVATRLYQAEKRPFWPHVTVARVRPEGGGSKRPARVSTLPGRLPKALLQPAVCRRVTLYRSELKPAGAEYVPLAQIELR